VATVVKYYTIGKAYSPLPRGFAPENEAAGIKDRNPCARRPGGTLPPRRAGRCLPKVPGDG